jgi:hypothetical protein
MHTARTQGYKKPTVTACTVEDGELDEWFVEERNKLEEEYYNAAKARKDSEKIRARFDKKYKALIAKLQHEQNKNYDHARRNAALLGPFRRVRAWMKLTIKQLEERWKNRGHPVRRWLFERKIKRIIKDKSNL